jgi:predicted ATP-grasp superfamily ATP-dependent carboligase
LTQQTVLIAALSGRALAASARRAGYIPLVVDAFGDSDTREAAGGFCCLASVTKAGFLAKPLIAALESLAGGAASAPIGLVLGSGFEDTPKLVAALARRFKLLGNSADVIARAKDPATFFPLLDSLGIMHPETRTEPLPETPTSGAGWVSKRIGASGGAHIIDGTSGDAKGRYFQRRLEGRPASLLGVAHDGRLSIVGFSEQWTVGTGPRPFRYAGACGPARLGDATEARMAGAAWALNRALGLSGIVSFDFMLNEDGPWLLEVNPRAGATLDVFDDGEGTLFEAHVAACRGESPALPKSNGAARAAALLYAGADPLMVGEVSWPAWTSDRPMPGTRIPKYRPVATVHATGPDVTTAKELSRHRLDELARMLYERAADTEHNNAKIRRSGPERVGAGRQTG